MIDYVAVTRDVLKLYKLVNIILDVMFVNRTPFLDNISFSITFVAAKHVLTSMVNQLSKSLKG